MHLCGSFPLPKQFQKNIDPSYKTDLIFWNCFRGGKPSYNRLITEDIRYFTLLPDEIVTIRKHTKKIFNNLDPKTTTCDNNQSVASHKKSALVNGENPAIFAFHMEFT